MLSSLPPELLLQIIESTVPSSFHSKTYDDRQHTLSSLSLVSQSFRAIAQPLLFEIVWIKSLATFDRYKTAIGRFGEGDRGVGKAWRPKIMVIGPKAYSGFIQMTQETISKEVVRLLNSTKSLVWDFCNSTFESFPSLTMFSNLSTLHLSMIFFDPDNVNFAKLPKLQSLTMFGVQGSLMASLLDPAVVPSLRHFSLVGSSVESVHQLKQSRIADLLPQLKTLNLHASIWLNPEVSFLHSAAERTLVNSIGWRWNDSTGGMARIVNLRLIATFLDGTQNQIEFVDEKLKTWVSNFQAPSDLSLRSIYLDSSLRPQPALPPPIAAMMDEFRILCRRRSIELIFDVVPKDSRLDNWISAEFIKRQKIRQNEVESNRVGGGGRSQQG
ncbi:hypothetical protein JCM3765_005471 [Sporobolomyces pararoseus]